MNATAAGRPETADVRSPLRAVALPTEHGGWGLTLEPVLLGLLVASSWAGALLGVIAFTAFLARTPLKLALVDRFRHRRLERTRLAERVAVAELVVITGALAGVIAAGPGPRWWWPVVIALPLVGIELWFDMRSRSRRLVPELAGSVGIAAIAASIVLADGRSLRLAGAVWLVLAGRSIASIPFVRTQIFRVRRGLESRQEATAGHAVGVLAAAVAAVLEPTVVLGTVAVVAAVALHTAWLRRPVPPVKTVGFQQMAIGLAVTIATAVGVALL
jgi:hypothetical protein